MTRSRSKRPVARGKVARPRRPRATSRERVRVGVSACLLGQNVRYDGGNKLHDFVVGELARRVTLVPVCPEVDLGLGTPREPIRLERAGRVLRLVAPGSGADHTEAMRRYAEKKATDLERLDISGYVFKKDSPSCGVEGVPVWRGEVASRSGRGAFASLLMERLPLVPVVEEASLHDRAGRERFLERVFAYRRLRARTIRRRLATP